MDIEIRNIRQKWFDEATPQNYKHASASIGTGTNGTVTVHQVLTEIDADDYEIAVVVPAEAGNLSSVLADKKITVTLGYKAEAKATSSIGSGDNGVVALEVDTAGADGNTTQVEVKIAAGANASLEAAYVAGVLTVTLGTGASAGVVSDAKNTATLVAQAINAISEIPLTATASGTGDSALTLAVAKKTFTGGVTAGVDTPKNTATLIAASISLITGFTATASGTGADAISAATAEDVAFTDGQYGTPCPAIGIGLLNGSTYYVGIKADNTKFNDGWRTFTLANY